MRCDVPKHSVVFWKPKELHELEYQNLIPEFLGFVLASCRYKVRRCHDKENPEHNHLSAENMKVMTRLCSALLKPEEVSSILYSAAAWIVVVSSVKRV